MWLCLCHWLWWSWWWLLAELAEYDAVKVIADLMKRKERKYGRER